MDPKNLLLAAALGLAPAAAQAQRTAIELAADRTQLRSDGRSRATITARVYSGNSPVADGTRIRFTTTAGRLDADTVATQGGVVRVTLTAADQPATARITANLETPGQAVPGELTVQFSPDAEDEPSQARRPWVRIKASEFVGYAIGVAGTRNRLVGAFSKIGASILTAGDLTIGAEALQLDPDRWTVRAVGNVILWRGRVSQNYAALRYDINTGKGVAQRLDGRVVAVEGRELKETDAPETPVGNFAIIDQGVADATVECREIALEQGGQGRILMKSARLYVHGDRIASLPFHTMTSNQRTLFKEQLVGLGANGVTLDLPIHYDVRPSALGTLHLRRGAQFGSSIYASRSGWSLDVDQGYERGGGQGLLQVLNLTRDTRGMRWQHQQRLGSFTDASLFVDSPRSTDLFATAQVGHAFRSFRANLYTSGTSTQSRDSVTGEKQPRSGDTRAQLLLETFPRALPGARWLQFTLNATSSVQRFFGSTVTSSEARTNAVGTRLLTRPIRLVAGWQATQSVIVGQTWAQGGGQSGVAVQGTTAFLRPVGSQGTIGISYDYIQSPQLVAFGNSANPKHRLGFSADLTDTRGWNLNVYGAQGLDVSQTTVSGGVGVPLGQSWEARTRLSYTSLTGTRYQETELALVRQVDGRTVGVYYSTTTRRFQVDLTGGVRL